MLGILCVCAPALQKGYQRLLCSPLEQETICFCFALFFVEQKNDLLVAVLVDC